MQMQTLKFVKKEVPSWTKGTVATPAGAVYRVSSEWTSADYRGMIKSRTGAFRMNYAVTPGLYAVGDPTKDSDVFVTANYKLTFDILRRELKGMNAWILVLDTKSINVWCAAGKGTFGTDELIKRIAEAKLETVVEPSQDHPAAARRCRRERKRGPEENRLPGLLRPGAGTGHPCICPGGL